MTAIIYDSFWFRENNTKGDIIEYRLFGTTSSPAIATYGLQEQPMKHRRNLVPLQETSYIMTFTLMTFMMAYQFFDCNGSVPKEDRRKSVQDLDLRRDILPPHSSLGVHWDLDKDVFTFRVALPEKPYTVCTIGLV